MKGAAAIVTGGGTGIGAATARLLAGQGFEVVIAGRRPELLAGVAAPVSAITAMAADLVEPDAPGRVVAEVTERFGRLDVLVNCAAVIRTHPLAEYTVDEIDQHVALEYMTRSFAGELAPLGIRVNAIAPGSIDTPIHETWADDLEEAYRWLASQVPLGRIGAPEEIARWVGLLVSPAATFVTGVMIPVDGGQALDIV
jgi:NAD(P)-dependent dehydrogenase (short-subunit alcohol dehydrogenase family)